MVARTTLCSMAAFKGGKRIGPGFLRGPLARRGTSARRRFHDNAPSTDYAPVKVVISCRCCGPNMEIPDKNVLDPESEAAKERNRAFQTARDLQGQARGERRPVAARRNGLSTSTPFMTQGSSASASLRFWRGGRWRGRFRNSRAAARCNGAIKSI